LPLLVASEPHALLNQAANNYYVCFAISGLAGTYRPIIKEVLKNSRGEYLFPKLNLDAAGSRCPFLPVKSSKSKPSASKSRSDRRSKVRGVGVGTRAESVLQS